MTLALDEVNYGVLKMDGLSHLAILFRQTQS